MFNHSQNRRFYVPGCTCPACHVMSAIVPCGPPVVCLCGSTRFFREFMEANYRETMAGKIVLSVGFFPHSSEEAHGEKIGITPEEKIALDDLHKWKIALADEVYVVDPCGYIGESTESEIVYALKHDKKVRWMERPIHVNWPASVFGFKEHPDGWTMYILARSNLLRRF